MKKILFAISAFALLTGISTSCQKEEASQQKNGNLNTGFTITATIADNGTKVSYSETDEHALKPSWVKNEDYIIGFDQNGKTYGFQATAVSDGGSATFTLVTSGDYAGTATEAPDDGTKMCMFYAPGAKPTEDVAFEGGDILLLYNLANQTKNVVPALMSASGTVTSGSLSLSFENQCAIIGIKNPTMASANTDYTSITLSGEEITTINTEACFYYTSSTGQLETIWQKPGTITKEVEFTSDGDKKASGVTYIAASPVGDSENLTTLFLRANNIFEEKIKSGVYMEAGNYYYMSPKFENTVLLPGIFSVSDTKKVRFTRGNLYVTLDHEMAIASSGTYHLESSQTACHSEFDSNLSTEVGLFLWSNSNDWQTSGKEPWRKQNGGSSSGDDEFFCGESHPMTVDGSSGLYALTAGLSEGEWNYLLEERDKYSDLMKGNVTIDGVEGCLVLAPDSYDYNISELGEEIQDEYSAEDWAEAEKAGFVCLPPTGYRSTSHVYEPDKLYYMSATPQNASDAWGILSNSDWIIVNSLARGDSGHAIRLASTFSESE